MDIKPRDYFSTDLANARQNTNLMQAEFICCESVPDGLRFLRQRASEVSSAAVWINHDVLTVGDVLHWQTETGCAFGLVESMGQEPFVDRVEYVIIISNKPMDWEAPSIPSCVTRVTWIGVGNQGWPTRDNCLCLFQPEESERAKTLERELQNNKTVIPPRAVPKVETKIVPLDVNSIREGRTIRGYWDDKENRYLIVHLIDSMRNSRRNLAWQDLASSFFSCPVCMEIKTDGSVCAGGCFVCAECAHHLKAKRGGFKCPRCRKVGSPLALADYEGRIYGSATEDDEDAETLVRFIYEMTRHFQGLPAYSAVGTAFTQESVYDWPHLISGTSLRKWSEYGAIPITGIADRQHKQDILQEMQDDAPGIIMVSIRFSDYGHMNTLLDISVV